MSGQIRNLGIGNLAGFTNLAVNQKNLILKAYKGFDNEVDYTTFIHELVSMNLGIDSNVYHNVLLKPQFYYFFLTYNKDFHDKDIKDFVILQFCQYLISLFITSLGEFSKRAMEFDIYEFERKQLKGQIGKVRA